LWRIDTSVEGLGFTILGLGDHNLLLDKLLLLLPASNANTDGDEEKDAYDCIWDSGFRV
jgi:hypothetical protein